MKLMMWLFGVTTRRNIVGKIRRFGIYWGWDRKMSRNVFFPKYYAACFIKSEDGTERISRNVVYFLQYYTLSVPSSLRMEPKGYPETSYISHNITPCLFHQVWGWNRKDIPKRRIFPTILHLVCFIKSEDGTERISRNVVYFPQYYTVSVPSSLRMGPKGYPETSYISYTITPCLFHQVWGWKRKDVPKRRIFPTILHLVCFIKSKDGTKGDILKRRIFPTILPCVSFIKSEDATERISRNVVSFLQSTLRLLHQFWAWNRKDIPKRRIFPTILTCVCFINSEDGTERKSPKLRIFPTILRCVCFIKPEDGTERISRNVVYFLQY